MDYAVLKPNQIDADVRAAAVLCRDRELASLCVRPCDVALAAELLAGSPVHVSCVLSFPHGDDSSATKVFQAQQAIADGVQEIDMVMNIGAFLSGQHDFVRDEIADVVRVAHEANVLVKVIVESGYLTLPQVTEAGRLVVEAGADFVKTSTGFSPISATPEAVAALIDAVDGKVGVKASGGIRRWDQAVSYLEQGATRLGVGSPEIILTPADQLHSFLDPAD
jgi:deoxyribose-phosphate aldolase